MACYVPPSPTVDEFAEVLLPEGNSWFDIGVFLGASAAEIEVIRQNHATNGVVTCLIKLNECLVKKEKPLTWDAIATALRRLGNHRLADAIHSEYILPAIRRIRRTSSNEDSTTSTTVHTPMDIPTSDCQVVTIKDNLVDEIFEEFQSLSERFSKLTIDIWKSFEAAACSLQHMQALIEDQCGLPPLPQSEATIGTVFCRLRKKCTILYFRPLIFIVNTLLNDEEKLRKELQNFKAAVDSLKKSAKMVDLASLIKLNQHIGADQRKVTLKLRDFWIEFTMEQFEVVMNTILDTLYEQLSHITVGTGCICVSWNIPPSVDYTKLLPKLSLDFLQIIGVISLHIGNDIIYNVGEEGCQTLEAAMLQATELKNTGAIELLLAVGCSPEVATYNGDHAVTNVVNIRERSVDDGSGGSVDHVCVLGHNEHIEAIIDTSREPECATCIMKEKQIKQLYAQVDILQHELKENEILTDTLKQKNIDLCLENDTLSSEYEAYQVKKDAEIEDLAENLKDQDAEVTKLTERLKFNDDSEAENSTELSSSSAIAESTSLNSALTEQIKSKDAAFIALMREKEQLMEELKLKDATFIELTRENEQHKDELNFHGYQTDLVPVWCHPELSSLQYAVIPVYRTIQHFSLHKANDKELYTDPFYTSKGGYKVTLRVDPNGYGSSKGTDVDVFMCLMKGANDNNLQFPMTGIFTVQVMNWMGDIQHFEQSIAFDDDTPVEYRERVVTGERTDGRGIQHMSHNELTSSNKQYLHEDNMCFKINFHPLPQTGDSTVPHWCNGIYANSITSPCIRTLDNFSVYKRTNAIWYSQPFYTSVDGYKLKLRVDANGAGSGAGTRLSLYIYLMKGNNDDKLSFPLNATITVQILNILSDSNHRERTIDHYNAHVGARTRVIEGDRAPRGWGLLDFISHTELLDNTNNSVKFIDNDKLYIRIVNVDIIIVD